MPRVSFAKLFFITSMQAVFEWCKVKIWCLQVHVNKVYKYRQHIFSCKGWRGNHVCYVFVASSERKWFHECILYMLSLLTYLLSFEYNKCLLKTPMHVAQCLQAHVHVSTWMPFEFTRKKEFEIKNWVDSCVHKLHVPAKSMFVMISQFIADLQIHFVNC